MYNNDPTVVLNTDHMKTTLIKRLLLGSHLGISDQGITVLHSL